MCVEKNKRRLKKKKKRLKHDSRQDILGVFSSNYIGRLCSYFAPWPCLYFLLLSRKETDGESGNHLSKVEGLWLALKPKQQVRNPEWDTCSAKGTCSVFDTTSRRRRVM